MEFEIPEVLRAIRSGAAARVRSPRTQSEAYDDRPLDIGYGATISQPYIVAAMTELLEVRKNS